MNNFGWFRAYFFEVFVASRYLISTKGALFISFITVLSLLGVALAVFAMIVILSVMGGFEEDLKSKMLRADPHITINSNSAKTIPNPEELVKKIDSLGKEGEILGFSEFVEGEFMLESQKRLTATELKGIIPDQWVKTSDIPGLIIEGDVNGLEGSLAVPGIILGERLAMDLLIGIGDVVNLISPFEYEGPMGMAPKTTGFLVVGIFSSGLYQIDATYSFVKIEEMRSFLSLSDDAVMGVDVKISEPYTSHLVVANLKKIFKSVELTVKDWQSRNSALFSALKLEKFAMAFILLITVLVASFSIVSTLFLKVMEKSSDIAVFKALGASKRAISRLFMMEGVLIGVGGTILGFVLGIIFLILLDRYKFIPLPSGVYHLEKLPVKFLVTEYVVICISSILLSLVATIIPARRASSMDPALGFRYE